MSPLALPRYRARAAAEGLTEAEWHRRALAYAEQHMPAGWPDSVRIGGR